MSPRPRGLSLIAAMIAAMAGSAAADGSSTYADRLKELGFSVQNSSQGAQTQLPAVVSYQYDDLKDQSTYKTDAYLSWTGLESWSTPATGEASFREFGPVLALESHATTQPSAPQNNLALSAGMHWDPTWQNWQSLMVKVTGAYESNSKQDQSDTGVTIDVRPKQLLWGGANGAVGLGNKPSVLAGTTKYVEFYAEPFLTGFYGKTLKDGGMPVEATYHARIDTGLSLSVITYPASNNTELTLRVDTSLHETLLTDAVGTQSSNLLSYQFQIGVGFGKLVTLGVQWKDTYDAPTFAETKQLGINLGLKI